VRRVLRGDIGITLGAALTLLGTFMPWVRSGQTSRSSYGLLGLVDRLEFAPDGPAAMAVKWWPLVPLLLTVSVVAVWWPRHSVAIPAAVVAGVYVCGMALALAKAPVPLLAGRMASIAGALVLLGAAAVLIAERPRPAA
jgi:hypothetical protein